MQAVTAAAVPQIRDCISVSDWGCAGWEGGGAGGCGVGGLGEGVSEGGWEGFVVVGLLNGWLSWLLDWRGFWVLDEEVL